MFSRRMERSITRSSKRRPRLAVEELEPRTLLSIFTPAQIRHAYGFDQVAFGSVAGTGAGQTIAIVDAYDDPRIASDLSTFDAAFGLPTANLIKAMPEGTPSVDAGWSLEMSLDVEWAHAIAPGAKILLVEARSSSFSDLINAVNYARNQTGVAAVSLSWGADEGYLSGSFERYYDSYFTTPSGHTGITFVASSGDDGGGYGPEWPAVSPNVLSVGGTSLHLTSAGNYYYESGWSGSTGGISFYEREPFYQYGVQRTGYRTNPDVAFVGDPYTGVYVYSSVPYGGYTGWYQVGGTSLGSPVWAALVAIADQGRAQVGTTNGTRAALDGYNNTLPALYGHPGDFHDVSSGYNSVAYATPGYDLVTGLGTPKANLLINDLLKVVSSFPAPSGGSTSSGASAPTSPSSITTSSGHRGGTSRGSANVSSAAGLDTAAPVTLLAGSRSGDTRLVTVAVAPPIVTPTPAPTAVVEAMSVPVPAPATVLAVGDAGFSTESTEVVTGDDGPLIAPVTPESPIMPSGTQPEGPQQPPVDQQLPPLDQRNDCTGTDGVWTAAFSSSAAPALAESDVETSAANGSLALAAALAGFWMTFAEKRTQGKRPGLNR